MALQIPDTSRLKIALIFSNAWEGLASVQQDKSPDKVKKHVRDYCEVVNQLLHRHGAQARLKEDQFVRVGHARSKGYDYSALHSSIKKAAKIQNK